MAELFLARAMGPGGFEKLVVLKKILPEYAASPKFVRLFLDEAKLAAGFDHPHIAHVYDMGTVDGNYFFTMEFVHGQDVRNLLRRTDRLKQKFPIEHAVQVARNVAAALHYAHERRRPDGTLLDIVHRDVSPSNVVISYDGGVKLLDFGVAKAASSSVKTRTGTLKGKIGYMSPEQARGGAIDRRCDIFSLGIVLWEMVATRRLYKAENDLATLQRIITADPPPLGEVRPDCPPELARIAARALAREPGERYPTAEEMQLDLEEFARENRLGQSSIALSKHMHGLFGAEIEAWKTAQASGITLTQHVVGASAVDMTTPVSTSESEASVFDEVDEDEAPAPPPRQPTSPIGAVIPRGDYTPTPRRLDHAPSHFDPAPMLRPPLMTPSSISIVSAQGSTPSGQMPVARLDPSGPFPLVPREWLPAADPRSTPDMPVARTSSSVRRGLLWAGGVAGALVVIAVVFVGTHWSGLRAGSQRALDAGSAMTAPVTAPVIREEPVVAVDAGAASPATTVVDAAVPAAVDAAVARPKPVVPIAPGKPHTAPPPPPTPGADHPVHNAPPPGPKRYDPNSALPPP